MDGLTGRARGLGEKYFSLMTSSGHCNLLKEQHLFSFYSIKQSKIVREAFSCKLSSIGCTYVRVWKRSPSADMSLAVGVGKGGAFVPSVFLEISIPWTLQRTQLQANIRLTQGPLLPLAAAAVFCVS